MFVAATHNGSHKHHDDLSFMIWHRGDLFTNGGTGGYDFLVITWRCTVFHLTVIGIQFDAVTEPLELLTRISLLP